jgi:hypothetical protein
MSEQPEKEKPELPVEAPYNPEDELEDPGYRIYSEQENLRHAADLVFANLPPEQISASLVERGVPEITARLMVEELIRSRAQAKRSRAVRNLVIGGILILLGVYGLFAPMLLNPTSSKILAIAAILYGAAQVSQGIILLRK